jgi:hypothetical protein
MTEIEDDTTEVEDKEVDDDVEDTDDEQADDEPDEQEQPKKGVRARLKDTEAERDALRQQLAGAHAAVLQQVCQDVGLTVEVATANGIRAEDHLDDETGAVDVPALTEAVEYKRLELGQSVTRRPKPNPLAGRGKDDGGGKAPANFGEVLREHVRGMRG